MRGIKILPSPAKTVDTARSLLDILAAAASLVVAINAPGLVVENFRSISALAADIHVCLGVALHRSSREWRCQDQGHSP